MKIKGKVWKFGDNVNTDYILPGRYMELTDPEEMALHLMEGIEPGFHNKVKKDDIIVGGENFGCGSSREHAPLAIKYAGIGCVLSESFARIFYRNSINIGLPALECSNLTGTVSEGDLLEVDLTKGVVHNLSSGESFDTKPIPDFMVRILNSGGLTNYIKNNKGW